MALTHALPHVQPPTLPQYEPPDAGAASLAAGAAPLVVLAVFVTLVLQLATLPAAAAVLCTTGLWLVHELHQHQRAVDQYNLAYVQRHLAWRSYASLQALARAPHVPEATRHFVLGYLANERSLLR